MTLAVAGLLCWLCTGGDSRRSRTSQLVALAMLLLILFPVISVTDDIWAAHNPAEADTWLRRDELSGHHHTITPEFAVLPAAQILDVCIAYLGRASSVEEQVLIPRAQTRFALFTRPPPTV